MKTEHNIHSTRDERQQQREIFLAICQEHNHLGEYSITPLEQDASNRKYFRLSQPHNSQTLILMDAPPALESIDSFIALDVHLQNLNQCVPIIYEKDIENGFLLLEDFGQNTYRHLLSKEPDSELMLYTKAVQCLIDIHQNEASTKITLPDYDFSMFMREAMLFADGFYPYCTGEALTSHQKETYQLAWKAIWENMPTTDDCLVLRDYHIDNLMIVNRSLTTQCENDLCGLLDFQDAVIGSSVYDLVSLIEDARRKVDDYVADTVLNQYLDACIELSMRKSFMTAYAVWGCQRHAKVLGLFCLFSRRDGKDKYLQYLPHIHKLFFSHINNPDLRSTFQPLRDWLDKNFAESYHIKW